MQIILQEDVAHLGEVGDVVNVKPGYARNYLLPKGLAVQADERQVRRMQHELRRVEARIAKQRTGAEGVRARLNKVILQVEKAAGENEKLFGSVTSMEIEALLREKGYEINRRKIHLEEPIKSLGEHKVSIKLHRDVVAEIRVQVFPKVEA